MGAAASRVLVRLLDFLAACFGSRRLSDTESREKLLPEAAKGVGQLGAATRTVHPDVPLAQVESRKQEQRRTRSILAVMRHGHREDEADSNWHLQASRPWDPPLSSKGREQAAEAGRRMREYHIDYVITSPFVRCLQTSAEIVSQLQLPAGRWLVDWRLSEVCSPRVLFSGRPDIAAALASKEMTEWMWRGRSLEETLQTFMQHESSKSKAAVHPEVRHTEVPSYPEDVRQGLNRYTRAIKEIMNTYEGKNVLVVTHGEALRQAVSLILPGAEVYEVQHTGHVILAQDHEANGEQWSLDSQPGETGVLWFEG